MIDMLVKGGIINFLHSQGVNTIQTADEGNQPPGDTFRGIIWPELTRFGPALDYFSVSSCHMLIVSRYAPLMSASLSASSCASRHKRM